MLHDTFTVYYIIISYNRHILYTLYNTALCTYIYNHIHNLFRNQHYHEMLCGSILSIFVTLAMRLEEGEH
jgi:hypothetical protein